MKLIAICFITLFEVAAFCSFAQNKSLLLINSAETDTVTFVTGDHIKIQINLFDSEIKGRLNEINDSSLRVGNTLVSLSSIRQMRLKNPAGMVIIKSIGATVTVLGALTTLLISAMHPIPSENPHQQHQYEEDLQDYHQAIIIGASVTAFGATSFLIHTPKYKFDKGWHPYVYAPVEVLNIDSAKITAAEPGLKDSVSQYPYNRKISRNAAYLQYSSEMKYSIHYDRLFKINNTLNLSASAGIGGGVRGSEDFIIPVSLGCVIGKKHHRIEIGQMSWFSINNSHSYNSNPSLLGIIAYRFQSDKGQVFFRGGILITEFSAHYFEHIINPCGSIGIGF
jgi:hypothetical protein